MALILALIFLAALVAPFLHARLKSRCALFLALVPAGACAWFARRTSAAAEGEGVRELWTWFPSFGITVSLHLDGLSLLFALLITGIGTLVVIYAKGYLEEDPKQGRFYALLFLFMGSMLGLVLAGDLILLFVFWELTTLSSYLLIGYEHESRASREAARKALLVTAAGGLAFLAGIILLGQVVGSYDVAAATGNGDLVRGSDLYLPILVLVLIGAFTKSAQFPFHFWLPAAMAAPTPVSAYLHSATMVKAGVYLLARLHPALGTTEAWTGALASFGGVTMLMSAGLALVQNDLKRILAWSTVSVLGTLVLLLAFATHEATVAALVLLVAHSFYKGGLFLVAGAVDHATGTRDIARLGGLRGKLPVLTCAAVLCCLSLAGIFFFGYIGKETYYTAVLGSSPRPSLVLGAALLTNSLLFATAVLVGWRPFFGRKIPPPEDVHGEPPTLWIGPLVLGLLGAAAGLAPGWVGSVFIAPAAGAVLRGPQTVNLELWHGFTPEVGLSLATVAVGLTAYAARDRLAQLRLKLAPLASYGPAGWYEGALSSLVAFARFQTRVLQNGFLIRYMQVVLCFVTAIVLYAFVTRSGFALPAAAISIRPLEAMVVFLMLASLVPVLWFRSRLAVVAGLGVVGYSVSVIFLLFGAPDLAITLVTIETLSVILFVLVLFRMPELARASAPWQKVRDAVISIAVGGTMSAVVMAVLATPMQPKISSFYAAQSVPAAKGRNVVNVILVDFRALDTLGEITVLGSAAIGVFALLKLCLSTRNAE